MNTMDKIDVMLHYYNGGQIEILNSNGQEWRLWKSEHEPSWCWDIISYRIKQPDKKVITKHIYCYYCTVTGVILYTGIPQLETKTFKRISDKEYDIKYEV